MPLGPWFHIRGSTGSSAGRLASVRVSGGLARAPVVVGREVELDTLRRAVRGAQSGDSACLFVVGEGGIGKTRLLAESEAFARQLDLAVLSGRPPIANPVAFSVVADAL